jgi:hypothetical protein
VIGIMAVSGWWLAALHVLVVPPLLFGSSYGLFRYLEDRHGRADDTAK